jgi:hypothetical protein
LIGVAHSSHPKRTACSTPTKLSLSNLAIPIARTLRITEAGRTVRVPPARVSIGCGAAVLCERAHLRRALAGVDARGPNGFQVLALSVAGAGVLLAVRGDAFAVEAAEKAVL